MLLAAISVLSMIVIVIGKILHPEVQAGWTSLMTIVLFMGSLQLLCLGLLGEYLGRAYLKINRKPQFSIRERIGL
jgi:undecaprenyl-phosphate 4-deoxy-4-formamido-L-arabinose transferase